MAKAADHPTSFLFRVSRALRHLELRGVDVNDFMQRVIDDTLFRQELVNFIGAVNAFELPKEIHIRARVRLYDHLDSLDRKQTEPFGVSNLHYFAVTPSEQFIRGLMEGLDHQSLSILSMFWGFDNGVKQSRASVARAHDISNERCKRILDRAHSHLLGQLYRHELLAAIQEGSADRLPIEVLDLSERARNCLRRARILTLADLLERTEKQLLGITHFGGIQLTEVKDKLGQYELALNPGR